MVQTFPEEQKGYRSGTIGTDNQLYTDQHILKETKARRKKRSHCMDWLPKGMWYGPANLDYKVSENV